LIQRRSGLAGGLRGIIALQEAMHGAGVRHVGRDLAEQQRGFEAFRLAWTEPSAARARLDGLYIWNWYGYGGPNTISYTPRGKPAAMTVKQILADLERP